MHNVKKVFFFDMYALNFRGKEALIDKFRSSSIVSPHSAVFRLYGSSDSCRWTNVRLGDRNYFIPPDVTKDFRKNFLHLLIRAAKNDRTSFPMTCINLAPSFITHLQLCATKNNQLLTAAFRLHGIFFTFYSFLS